MFLKKCSQGIVFTLLSFAVILWMTPFALAASRVESVDQDGDGKKETQKFYNDKDTLVRTAKDTNGDGKPDQFTKFLKGRNLILREFDANGDGKIDKRKLMEWGSRRLVPGQSEIPSYVPLQTEEDSNYDGKIDAYTEKGNKDAAKTKIGQPFNTRIST